MLAEVANTYDEFNEPHPERYPIDRGNIVGLQQLLQLRQFLGLQRVGGGLVFLLTHTCNRHLPAKVIRLTERKFLVELRTWPGNLGCEATIISMFPIIGGPFPTASPHSNNRNLIWLCSMGCLCLLECRADHHPPAPRAT